MSHVCEKEFVNYALRTQDFVYDSGFNRLEISYDIYNPQLPTKIGDSLEAVANYLVVMYSRLQNSNLVLPVPISTITINQNDILV